MAILTRSAIGKSIPLALICYSSSTDLGSEIGYLRPLVYADIGAYKGLSLSNK